MAKKVFLQDENKVEILPITRGELVLDSSGNPAFSSNEFLATTSQPGLMSKEDKIKINSLSTYTLEISNLLLSGKKIATLDVGGTSYNILAPATYAWSEITDRPTKLSQFTDDVVAGKYLPLTGGTISTNIATNTPLIIQSLYDGVGWVGIAYKNKDGNLGGLGINKDGTPLFVTSDKVNAYTILHAGNYSQYALPLTGNAASATKLAKAVSLWGNTFDGTQSLNGDMKFANNTALFIQTSDKTAYRNLFYYDTSNTLFIGRDAGENGERVSIFGSPLVFGNTRGSTAMTITKEGNVQINKGGLNVAGAIIGNLDGTYVNKLTGYTKATAISALAATDTLNTALGKLEYKADVAYNLVRGAYDGDGTIENLEEILRVLEDISDTDTIQAIVGKYLPLTGGELTGSLSIKCVSDRKLILDNTDGEKWSLISFRESGEEYGYLGVTGSSDLNWNGAIVLHSANYNTYAPKLDGTGASGTWNINISGSAENAYCLVPIELKTESLGSLYKSSRVYYAGGSNSVLDRPVGVDAFGLLNMRTALGWYGQILISANNAQGIYFRTQPEANLYGSEWKKLAFTSDIPTKVSQLTNDSGYLTSASLDNYVTLNTAQTITGLKTFESNSSTTGVSLILKNRGWTGNMSTAMDFYNGRNYDVPNARIETKMVGSGSAGGTLIFYTQTAHASTNPNPNGLVERLRIDDGGNIKVSGTLNVANSIYTSGSFYLQNTLRLHSNDGNELWVNYGGGAKDGNLYLCGYNMRFYSGNSANYNTSMYIDANGYVGIGTQYPEARLHVNGSLLINNTSSGEQSIIFRTGTASEYGTYDYKIGKFTDANDVTGFGFAMNQSDGSWKKFLKITTSGTYVVEYVDILAGLTVSDYIHSSGFVKYGSNNNYILLGGGGQKAISDFMLKSDALTNNLTTITKSLNVTADWMDTGIKSTDLAKGTYIIQVSVSGNDSTASMWDCIWSGIMSWDPQVTNDNEPDEIILHRAGHAYANTIYIRTLMTPRDTSGVGLKLQIAANKNIGAAYTYTFKFKRVI